MSHNKNEAEYEDSLRELEEKRKTPIGRVLLASLLALLTVASSVVIIMQTSLSTRIEIKTCGGFFPSPGYQCRPDSFQEKVRVTVFQPIKSDTLIPITLAMVVFLAIIIALAYREHQWHPEVIAVGVSIWAIAALVAVLFVGSLGLGDKIELVGAITAEDQACQMRAVRSMDDLSPVPDCPSTPLSRAFWDIRDLLEDGQ